MKDFDKIGLIKKAWEIVKKNAKLIGILLVIYFAFNFAQSFVVGMLGESMLLANIVSLAFTVGAIFLQLGFYKIILDLVDGKNPTFQQLWAYPQYLLRGIAVTILSGLAILGGLILLVIPGIYIAIRLQFALYYLVDKNTGVMDSLKGSWNITQGNVLNIFLFMLILIGLNILGAIALLVGLLITIPVSFIAVTLLYRKLSA